MGLYLAGLLILGLVALHLILRPLPAQHPFAISHRGAAGLAPENTLLGVQAAVSLRVAFTEIDVRQAADGVLVVMHDRSLSRTTGCQAYVDDLPSGDITQLKVNRGFQAPGECVPSLDTIVEFVTGRAIRLVVEVKDPKLYPGIEQQLAKAVQRLAVKGQVAVASFDHAWLKRLNALEPDIPVMPIATWFSSLPASLSTKLAAVWWLSVILDPMLVRRLHRQGCQVEVWTVDNVFLMRLLYALGVDGITTNRPDLCQKIVDHRLRLRRPRLPSALR